MVASPRKKRTLKRGFAQLPFYKGSYCLSLQQINTKHKIENEGDAS